MPRTNLVGQVLGGRYRVDEMAGQGGMSAVYKAYDPNLKRVVAIKTIHSNLADDPRFLARFEEEATAVAKLRHPNIVQVFDYSHDEDLYYMVQEFVPGETLQERLRRLNKAGKRMPLSEAIEITLNTADAAGYAHRRGMIHRDIKPANIMLDVHGQAILMDFGIVKLLGAGHQTATGAVVGTALYMPPEVIQGEVPDARSDLYSLGVTLYEMVSGRPPFEADSTMALMMMHVQHPVPDLRALRPGVPDALIAVIEKALAKNRADRYGSMAELATALREAMAQVEAAAAPGATAFEERAPAARVATPPPAGAGGGSGLSSGPKVQPGPDSSPFRAAETPYPRPAPVQPVQEPAGGQGTGPSHVQWADTNRPAAAPAGQAAPVARADLTPAAARPKVSPAVWVGGAVLALAIVAGVLFALLRSPGKPAASPAAASPTATSPAALPAGAPFARITGITLDNQQRYVVAYQSSGLSAQASDLHLHFFFNTVPPGQAGTPAQEEWTEYGGSSPFAQIKAGDRPANASQLCVLVANSDHSVRPNSGTCAVLPNVVAAVALQDTACLAGPATSFSPVTQLKTGDVALVRGLSSDESWWNVANPQSLDQSCWLSILATQVTGDISTVPPAEASSPPAAATPATATPAGLSVEIIHIGIDGQGRYVVQFSTTGFTAQVPGTHIHFFFDTVSPEQAGASGDGLRAIYGGPSPFSGYLTTDRPAAASMLCALVANADNSVVPGSGNCVILPDAP